MDYIKRVLVIGLLIINISVSAQIQHNLSDKNLTGDVEYFQEISFSAVKKNGEYFKGNRRDSWTKDENIWFDKNGNYIKKQKINSDGSVFEEHIYKYNIDNKLVEVSKYRNEEPSGKIILKYNNNNLLISQTHYYSDGSVEYLTTFKYDNKNLKIEDITYEDGEFYNKNTYTYDDNNNLIVLYEDFADKKENLNHFYTYNNENLLIETSTVNHLDKIESTGTYSYVNNKYIEENTILGADGRVINKFIFTYNDNNILIQEVIERGIYNKITYLHTIDEYGNRTETKEYKNDALIFVYEYEINYFN